VRKSDPDALEEEIVRRVLEIARIIAESSLTQEVSVRVSSVVWYAIASLETGSMSIPYLRGVSPYLSRSPNRERLPTRLLLKVKRALREELGCEIVKRARGEYAVIRKVAAPAATPRAGVALADDGGPEGAIRVRVTA